MHRASLAQIVVKEHIMRTRPCLVALCAALFLLLPVPVASAAGAMTVAASGTFTITSLTPTVVQTVGGVTILDVKSTTSFTGTFTGTSVAEATCIVQATGQGTCFGPETFTGTVAGRSGTVQFFDTYAITNTSVQGQAVITGGTAGVQGRVTFQGGLTSGTYAGQLVVP
jgi:hypothetical protein